MLCGRVVIVDLNNSVLLGEGKASLENKAVNTHPPNPKRSVIKNNYTDICRTHRKLVKTGQIQSSLVVTPIEVKIDVPAAPSSPIPVPGQEGSVNWGVIGESSGVVTPENSSQPEI